MVKNNWLTYEERKEIERLLKRLYSCSDISRMIGRGRNTVIAEVRRNGGRENYKAKEAQENAYKLREQANVKRKNYAKENKFNPFLALNGRIDQIEMHLDIITETLKELTNEIKKD